MSLSGCEYCGRSAYMNDGPTCAGCGAPVKPVGIYGDGSGVQAYIYDPRVFDGEVPLLGRPGVNIPVNVPHRSRISDFINTGAIVGASMLGRTRF